MDRFLNLSVYLLYMPAEGYKNVGIPESLWNKIQFFKNTYPTKFDWRSINEFCVDAVRKQVREFEHDLDERPIYPSGEK